MEPVVYQDMKPGEESAVCELVAQVFNKLVAPGYEQEGIEEFFRFANPIALAERIRSGGFVLVARKSGNLVGALEFALPDHIAMLFVILRKQGIGKELLGRAIDKARSENSALSKVTVHSSPYAEAAYEKMGFRRIGDDTIEHGIRFIPMELLLSRTNA
ncbi:MAG: GNAT family N-acetyltransferase [Gammaproteobacteria bacterium]|jgi:GNAT superfamily N-acetyltransferase